MIIAIAGVSQAGKSTLAAKLRSLLGHNRVTILCQDDFVKEVQQIPKINDHVDWEHPHSIDHDLLRVTMIAEAQRTEFVIVEGLMMLWDKQTRSLFDKCLFIEIDKETFIRRKLLDQRWGIEPEWYMEHIWQSYLRFGQLPEGLNCLRLNGCKDVNNSLLLDYINSSNVGRAH